ncbi:MAG: hypothetical protein PVJ80_07115 [Gemmatimonadota bacterium]|jgi:hypothetical protein
MSERRAIPVAGCVMSALVASACGGPQPLPPEPAPPDAPTFVSTIFDLAWNASVDHFSAYSIPVATVDRDAGEIETERLPVAPDEAIEFADCGTVPGANPEPILATSVVYHVVVRDEGRSSTVLVTASWDTSDPNAPFPCESTGVQEGEMQEAIKLAAEVNR